MVRYATTILLGAFLLFCVQPQIARFILPWFGGGTAVWSTCMLFFQVLLLGGYAYAHWISRRFTRRSQAILHTTLLLASFAFLPVVPGDAWKPTGSENPALHILLLLTATVGLPYLLLAATGPLLQSWFAREFEGRSPYRLYALSNVGSLAALLGFPFLLEPNVTIGLQANLWAGLYLVFAVLCGLCAWRTAPAVARVEPPWTDPEPGPTPAVADAPDYEAIGADHGGGVAVAAPPIVTSSTAAASTATTAAAAATAAVASRTTTPAPTSAQRMSWLGLSALPSATLLAVTNLICQDIAVVPFFWVMPLAIYLVTFILTFDSDRWYRPASMAAALVLVAGFVFLARHEEFFARAVLAPGLLLAALLFFCGMVCHGQLVRQRPDPSHLTGFYLTISLGGALGGLFVALLAPLIFVTYAEVEITILASVAIAVVSVWKRPQLRGVLAAAALGVVLVGFWFRASDTVEAVEESRNFYGRLRVVEHIEAVEHNGRTFAKTTLTLEHGQTIHGRQVVSDSPELQEGGMTYYAPATGVGYALRNHPAAKKRGLRIGVIGLGAGTLAAYARPEDHLTFYEIDPEIVRIAESRFTYLRDARKRGATIDVKLGDGRIQLERDATAKSNPFDILVVDAFSSDAIPVHLLTKECNQLYWRRIAESGLLLIHVSNRHLALAPIVRGLAEDADKETRIVTNSVEDLRGKITSQWAMVTANREFLSRPELQLSGPKKKAHTLLWTDDFSSLWHILK